MNKKLYPVAVAVLLSGGCGGGGGCPDIYIPVYEVNVYDSVSGDLICYQGISTKPNLESCNINIDYSEDRKSADIDVSLSGYISQTQEAVNNQTWRGGCWDSPEYTTVVDFYLIPE